MSHFKFTALENKIISSIVHMTANKETKNINVFKFTGSIEIEAHFAEVTEATASSVMTAAYADLWDGTNSVVLTKNTCDLSGIGVGGLIKKVDVATSEYLLSLSDQVRLYEASGLKPFQPFVIIAKNGVNNYFRFNFTTSLANFDIKMELFLKYRLLTDRSSIVAV